MRINPRLRRFLTILLVVFVVAAASMSGLYLWFIHNTTTALRRMVENRSNNTLTLEVKKLRFNPFTHKLAARSAHLFSVDTLHQTVTYDVRVPSLDVQVSSIWELLVHRHLLLDSIQLLDPLVQVTRRFKDKTATSDSVISSSDDGLSVAQEIGDVYNSMLNGLENFGVNRIRMKNAGFQLSDLTQPDLSPTFVNRIDLDLRRDPKFKTDAYVEGSQSLDVQILNQDIQMPNGRHRLSFGKFKLELFRQRVVLDSCTVSAIQTDSARSSYNIFFDSLILVGVDFAAMYRSNVLRADSVYCVSPVFNVHVDNSKAPVKVPDPAKVIREFTSDMDMNYLAVKDATIKLDVQGRKNRALVNSNADNFEIHGLRVYADSVVPVAVDEFELRVSDYKLYNIDSTTVYAFDSVHFRNNTIALSNFSVVTTSHPNRLRNERSFEIPHFALTGLDWYQLIFEQNLRAREAVLYHPDIRYTRHLPVPQQSQTQIISSLHTLDSLLTLDRITIVNGRVMASLGNDGSFEFEDVDLLMNSGRVLSATGVTELRDALQRLVFSNGHIRYGNADIALENVRSANGLVEAGKIEFASNDGAIDATVHNAIVGNMLLDNKTESALINGINWDEAVVTLHALPKISDSLESSNKNLALRNVAGRNTKLILDIDSMQASTFIKSIQIAALDKTGNGPVRVQNVAVDGNAFNLRERNMRVIAKDYSIVDDAINVNDLVIDYHGNDTLYFHAPTTKVNADINRLLNNNFDAKRIEIFQPSIRIVTNESEKERSNSAFSQNIHHIILHEPAVSIQSTNHAGTTSLAMPSRKNGLVELTDLNFDSSGFRLAFFRLNTDRILMESASDERFSIDTGSLMLKLNDVVSYSQTDSNSWAAHVDSLQLYNGAAFVQTKQGKFSFDSLVTGNIGLSNNTTTDKHAFAVQNKMAWIQTFTGGYEDSVSALQWYNVRLEPLKQEVKLDSFSFHPRLSRDEFIARAPYQTDYVTFSTGAVSLEKFRYNSAEDSAFTIHYATVHHPIITAYRDKKAPFHHGITKPLPTDMVRRIPFRLNAQRVDIYNGFTSYTERNARTRNTGTITLNRMNGSIINAKNFGLVEKDSLTLLMDAWLLNTVGTHVRLRQAYVDTLNTFRLSVWLEPAPLPALNPVLAPLMNVAVTSGELDSFRMRAIGREYVSLGETEMFYHDLRVRLLKDGDLNKRSFKHRMASRVINAFVIKSNNKDRVGVVFYERDRERSFFNYLVKMTVSGMGTSMGFKRNERSLKRYNRTIEQKAAPPIDFEISDPRLDEKKIESTR